MGFAGKQGVEAERAGRRKSFCFEARSRSIKKRSSTKFKRHKMPLSLRIKLLLVTCVFRGPFSRNLFLLPARSASTPCFHLHTMDTQKNPLPAIVSKGRNVRGTTLVCHSVIPVRILSCNGDRAGTLTVWDCRIMRSVMIMDCPVRRSGSKATFRNPSPKRPLSLRRSLWRRMTTYSSLSLPLCYSL